jgi:hypothetical protein
MGAAMLAPCAPCSTTATMTISGGLPGGPAMPANNAWSLVSPWTLRLVCAVPVLPRTSQYWSAVA